jgi:hypothetical protein
MTLLKKTVILIALMLAMIYIDKLVFPDLVPPSKYPDMFYEH